MYITTHCLTGPKNDKGKENSLCQLVHRSVTIFKFSPKTYLYHITATHNPCTTDAVVYMAVLFLLLLSKLLLLKQVIGNQGGFG